jgi:hypothetical protein
MGNVAQAYTTWYRKSFLWDSNVLTYGRAISHYQLSLFDARISNLL